MISKKTFRLWWGWNPNKIESYLESMEQKGWHLVSVKNGMTVFEFTKSSPKKIAYAMDYTNNIAEEYVTIAKDDGWECVGKSVGWVMWRKEYNQEKPKILTDNQSLIDRNTRLIRFILPMMLLQLPIIIMNFIDRDFTEHTLTRIVILAIYLPIVCLGIYGLTRLIISTKKLKNQGIR